MKYKIPPWKHQLEAIERAKYLPGFGLFFEPGTGKTGTTINILRHKFNEEKRIFRTLIFAPSIVVPNWRDEWRLHSSIDPREIVLLQGPGSKRLADFSRASAGGKIFVTNYESLLMGPLFASFQSWRPEVIVFDESHKCKSSTAKRSKLADVLVNPYDKAARRPGPRPLSYILSGSPVLNSPMDLFQQFLLLDGGASFGANYFAFRAKYFRDRNAGMPKDRYFPKWEIRTKRIDGFDALGEMTDRMSAISMRAEKEKCLDLPGELSIIQKVGMTAEQARVYEELKKDFVTFMGGASCVVTLAITKALRLMQITSGFLPLVRAPSGEEFQPDEDAPIKHSFAGNPKMDALKELLENITPTHKVLVWAVWKENYGQIRNVCNELGIKCVEVHGGVDAKSKEAHVEQFKSDDETRVFIGHPGSGGIGINLTCAPYSIFYSRTFSLEHYIQARARNYRGGQMEKVTHYDLVCENTIDELAVKALANKQSLSETLLRDLSLSM